MKRHQEKQDGLCGMERVTRRVKNGVEILERETVTTIKMADTVKSRTPRLVISDAISEAKLFVAKTRSELGELDAFLRSAMRPALRIK
jgi:hypothetical protein